MPLRDDLERALADVLQQHPDTERAIHEGPEHGRGEAALATRDLITARNALLDAASRLDRTVEA